MTARSAAAPRAAAGQLSKAQFLRFQDLIEAQCGLHLDETHRASLLASLQIRMKQLELERVDDYYDHLGKRPAEDELAKLINLLTVTETCFFRDGSQFRLLRLHILPALLAELDAGRKAGLRIWSAGCSTGAEPYSIALTLSEMGLYGAYPPGTFDIVGTDVNTEALDAARRGIYSARALRNVDADQRRRYFQAAGPDFRLNDDIRRRVRFEYGNLTRLAEAQSPRYDLVFCKNVAIYFRPERVSRLVQDLYGAVNDGGYLLLGHSESLWEPARGFRLVEHDGVFCYRNRRLSRTRIPVARAAAPVPPPRSSPLADVAGGLYERCLAAFRAEAWAGAEESLHELIASSPHYVPAYLLLGGVYAHRGRYQEADEQARHALRLNPLEARAHLLQGMIAAWSGRTTEAGESLRRALYLNDSLALARLWLGNLYGAEGDAGRACVEYQNVVRDWERHTLDFTEEFAADLSAKQVVEYCRQSLQRLRPPGNA